MELRTTRRHVLAAGLAVLGSAPPRARAAADALDRLLARRRMVRRFTPEPVSDAAVNRLLAAAVRAPSAGHTQPWAFVVVREAARRRALGEAALAQRWLADAPVAVVACADVARSRARYGRRAERYAVVDTAFASLLLLLQVVEEGLGACFVGAFDDAAVVDLLSLPRDVQPLAIIPVGHAAETPRPHAIRPVRSVRHDERWQATR
jgi:nitroreductase